jgi:hypothetical protein
MFTLVSWASLGIAFICAIVIAIDEIRHPPAVTPNPPPVSGSNYVQ